MNLKEKENWVCFLLNVFDEELLERIQALLCLISILTVLWGLQMLILLCCGVVALIVSCCPSLIRKSCIPHLGLLRIPSASSGNAFFPSYVCKSLLNISAEVGL